MPYELKLAKYNGPLEKLLELIEARQMEISEISLAAVTDDFLRYLDTLKKEERVSAGDRSDMRLLADFVVIASRLIFIKSRSLLPDLDLTRDEEADIQDLEHRLKLYREFRPAMKNIAELWRTGNSALARPYFLNLATWMMPRPDVEPIGNGDLKFFHPGENMNLAALQAGLHKLLDTFEAYLKESEVVRDKIVSLEEKITEIIGRLKNISATSFSSLSDGGSKSDTIITFLAILHLAREQLLFVEQDGPGSDIMIKRASAIEHGNS